MAEALGRRGKCLRILIGSIDEFCDRVAVAGLHPCDSSGGGKLHLSDTGSDQGRGERADIHDANSRERGRIAAAG